MKLYPDIPRVIADLDDFHKITIRVSTGNNQTTRLHLLPVRVVEFKTMPVSFRNFIFFIGKVGGGTLFERAGTSTKSHGGSLILYLFLIIHNVNYGIRCIRVKFFAVCFCQTQNISGEINHGNLHTQAQSEIGEIIFPGEFGSDYFSLRSTISKSTGNQNAMEISKVGIGAILLDFFRIDMNHHDLTIVTNSTVYQGLVNREIGILEVHVFPDHSNLDFMFWI